MPRTSRASRTAMMRANVAVPIERYSQLLEVLNRHKWGSFLVTMRGGHPVKIARLERAQLLTIDKEVRERGKGNIKLDDSAKSLQGG